MEDAAAGLGPKPEHKPDWPEFLGQATHALRSPLTAMMAYLELLVEGELGPLNEAQAEALGVIDEGASQMRRVMDQVVLAARLTASDAFEEPEPCDLAEVLRASLSECESRRAASSAAAAPVVSLEISDDLPWALCDLEASRQIVAAVLENALDFSPGGGMVAIALEPDPTASELHLSVRDKGPGIGEEDLVRVGEAFFRASNSAGRQIRGPGLGLFIAGRLLGNCGGSLRIESWEGEGTLVSLRFPSL